MRVSCKVSYSVIVYLERRQGVLLEPFFQVSETPVELFKDPSGWVEASEMENFLVALSQHLKIQNPQRFYGEVGLQNFELRAWGVLDSVLKMVESPKDIFTQPGRFLSYFLAPQPELLVENSEEAKVRFKFLESPAEEHVLAYLLGALEGLPHYMGTPPAQIKSLGPWEYQIHWSDNQGSLFDEQEKKRRQFHPEIVHSVMQNLKDHQPDVTKANDILESPQHMASEAFEKMVSLEVEKRLSTWMKKQEEFDQALFKIKNDFYKMYDYFSRAQQIITLLSPSARQALVREVTRRVDWEYVQEEFPKTVEMACDSIIAMKDAFHTTLEESSVPPPPDLQKPVDLNELIESVVEGLDAQEKALRVDRRLLLDRAVKVDPQSFASALGDVFQNSLASSHKDAEMKIVTRASGGKVQIEITDSGMGFSPESLQSLFQSESSLSLKKSQEIIKRHRGNISVSSRQGEGATYLIELPG